MADGLFDDAISRGLAEGRRRGRKEGRKEGQQLLATLIGKLLEDSRNEEIGMVVQNVDYREKLYSEYGIK